MSWRSKRVKPIQQMEAAECGVACLAMVLASHGAAIPLDELREICGTSRDGNSALEIVHTARKLGLEARGLKLEPSQLPNRRLPLILHWGLNHFVVLESYSRRGAVVVNPASGRGKIDTEEFGRRFTGVALELEPTRALRKRRPRSPGVIHYFSALRRYRSAVALVAIAGAASQALGVVGPAVHQLLIDEVIRPAREAWLVPVLGVVVGASLVGLLLQGTYTSALARLQVALGASLTSELGKRLLTLPLPFVERRGQSDLLQRVGAYSGLGSLLTSSVLAVFNLFFATALAGLMLAYDAPLAALTLSVDLVRIGLVRMLRAECRQRAASEVAARARETSIVIQATTMPETVKAFGIESRLQRWYASRLEERLGWTVRSEQLSASVGAGLGVLDGIARACVLWYGGSRVVEGELSLGVFAGFLAMRGLMSGPLGSLLQLVEGWADFRNVLTRTDELQRQVPCGQGCFDARHLRPRLELLNVGFRYSNGSPWVFRGVSLSIEPGEKVTLVGPSGGGKSTLLRIMAGLVQPTEGKVLLDGVDIAACSPQTLRAKLGSVLGDPLVLGTTVAENLRVRSPAASAAQMHRAAKRACWTEVVKRLPLGYDTRLEPGGTSLSGGERQRLGIAQALVEEPQLLFLDEATCYLDADTEDRVLHGIDELGATVVSVAHRPRVMQASDRLVVVAAGEVREMPLSAESLTTESWTEAKTAALSPGDPGSPRQAASGAQRGHRAA